MAQEVRNPSNMLRVKIVCTIGPASRELPVLR
ncbi:MAG: hypothetical protein KDD91_05030, partial [Caldilinea sp.]|nr:hypothetical protein [Caldilinea sp.]